VSNLLLDLKFILFLRVFEQFGAYFTIILGVAKKVFSFLVILFAIIISFSHAFYTLLKPSQISTVDNPTINGDPNNPWNLVNKYYTYFRNNNSYSLDSYTVQKPDGSTNMFTFFSSSLLAIYNFLAGKFGLILNQLLLVIILRNYFHCIVHLDLGNYKMILIWQY